MKKNFLVLNSLIFTLMSATCIQCVGPVKRNSDIKWTGHNTVINTILENRGAFEYKQYRDVFIFYDDGTLVFSNLNFDDTTRICPIPWPYDSINTSDVDWSSIYGTGLSWPPGAYYDTDLDQWDIGATGLYRLEGDTIYANLYWRNCFHFSLRTRFYFSTELWKLKFRVLDRTTIELCEKRYIDKEFPYPKICHDTLCFREVPLPPPNTEMKKKRWLWKTNR